MKALIGVKNEMSQFFREDGVVIPVTILDIPRNIVLRNKTTDSDGYNALQVGAGEKKEKNIGKAQLGEFADLGNFRFVCEFAGQSELERGAELIIEQFTAGDIVCVTGASKGKGFQGVVKRHGFHGSTSTHGHRHNVRKGGSIGATGLNRVMKGMKMPGRMGNEQTTVKNLQIVHLDPERNQILIKGAIPGRRGSMVKIYTN